MWLNLMNSAKKKIRLLRGCLMISAVFTFCYLGGCASLAIGGGAKLGTAAYQERGIQGVARDMAIAIRMRASLVNAGKDFIIGLSIDVFEGRMLLTGTLPNKAMQAKAVSMAWETDGVKDVINEIQTEVTSLIHISKDTLISTQLLSKITFDQKVLAINYSVKTVNGIIYLIGIAQNQAELDRVILHARTISYVNKIINYVRVKEGAT